MTNDQASMTSQTTMTNDQAPMTNQTANSNDQCPATCRNWALLFRFRFIGHWCLVIGHSMAIGAWSLVIQWPLVLGH
jgi:hypothetical protein